MSSAFSSLPDDIESLKALVLEQAARNTQLTERLEHTSSRNTHLEARTLTLTEQLNLALARRYAARSEKISADQLALFDEAEADTASVEATGAEVHDEEADDTDTVEIAAHTRKRRGRKLLPDTLPRIEDVHDLPEHERICPHDGGQLKEIGESVSEQLDIAPATIQVIRHIRKKYACACGQCIKTAALAPQPIAKSLVSQGLLAHVVVSKYTDALPLYRQEQILQRIGVDIPRASLANRMIRAGALIQPLVNLLRDVELGYDILSMDETPVQVLKEPGKSCRPTSYIWVQRGGPPDRPVILYDYDPLRSGAVPNGCWPVMQQVICRRTALYRVEKQARDFTPEERHAYRDTHAGLIIDKLRAWLDIPRSQVPPKTATGEAFKYLDDQWYKLVRYLDDGRLAIDNNLTENANRPFVVGRKNWSFSDTVKGVNASANLYSLIEAAKANGLEPYTYLREVFTRLATADTVDDIEALLPFHVASAQTPS